MQRNAVAHAELERQEDDNALTVSVPVSNPQSTETVETAPREMVPSMTDVAGMAMFIARRVARQQIANLNQLLERESAPHRRASLQATIEAWSGENEHAADRGSGLAEDIAAMNTAGLIERLRTHNRGSRGAFTAITGVSLPRTERDTKAAIAQWAGTTVEAYEEAMLTRRQSRHDAARPVELRDTCERTRRIAQTQKVKVGHQVSTGAAYIDDLYQRGYTRLAKVGEGAVKLWALVDAAGSGYRLSAKSLSGYAKALCELRDYERAHPAIATLDQPLIAQAHSDEECSDESSNQSGDESGDAQAPRG